MLKAFRFLLIPVLGIFLFFFGFSEKIVLAEGMFGNGNDGDWTKKQEIQINPDKVIGDLVDFPLLITEANISAEIFSQTLQGGCDIRFTANGDENNLEEIAFEIVNFDKEDNKAEIWVKVPFINSLATTSIWIWWGNNSASCYAPDDLFGRNSVWYDYDDVFHLNESSGAAIAVNSVSVYDGGEYFGDVPNISRGGKIGNSQYFDGNEDEVVTSHMVNLYNKDFTIGAWVYSDVMGDNSIISRWGGNGCLCWTLRTDWSRSLATRYAWTFGYSTDGTGDTEVFKYGAKHVLNDWIYVTVAKRNNHFYIGANGIEVGIGYFNINIYEGTTKGVVIGGTVNYSDMYFNGMIDEARVSSKVGRSAEWIKTEYNNQNSPQDFAVGQEAQNVGDDPQQQNFSFVHMTDPHIGSSYIVKWSEELSYPRFTDGLYEISRLTKKPDFILMGGDLVEYAESRWLKDYQSMIDSFTAQTSIPVYAVPGNHDRYSKITGSVSCKFLWHDNCDDELEEYKKQINIPGRGLNESNYLDSNNSLDYQFTHKGIQFIGLDTGADYMLDFELKDLSIDKGIEGDGFTNNQMSALEELDLEIPKVVFMHHPVLTGNKDTCDDSTCPRYILEDASFVDNYDEFFYWATNSNLQLALTGHTHREEIYDQYYYKHDDAASATNRPLFIQTQSATKDSEKGHGYRLIKVEDGAVNPQDVSETSEYIKLINRLDTKKDLGFHIYNPNNLGDHINIDNFNVLPLPFFSVAKDSKRIFIYNPEQNYTKLRVFGNNVGSNEKYNLEARLEDVELDNPLYDNDFAFFAKYPTRSFINCHIENKSFEIDFKKFKIDKTETHQMEINWNDLVKNEKQENIILKRDENGDDNFENIGLKPMKDSIIARLFSPAELVVIKNGKQTGIVNHESVEEIDYSLSDDERERVLVYFKDGFANEEFIYRVQGIGDIYGSGEDEYSLKIVLKIDEEIKEVNIIDMPISSSTVYQFYVDWDNLSDTHGVIMEIDEDGDEVFEIRIELGQEINSANPYYLREKMILNLESVKTGETQADEKIDFIISLINKSLNSDWWENDYYLNKELGDNVFKTDLITVQKLRLFLGLDAVFNNKKYIPEFIKDKFVLSDDVRAVFENVLNDLLHSDMILAQIAVNSFAWEVDSKKDEKILKNAEEKLEKAEKLLYNKKIQIVQFCRQAWRIVN